VPCAPTGSPESVPRSGAPAVLALSGPMAKPRVWDSVAACNPTVTSVFA